MPVGRDAIAVGHFQTDGEASEEPIGSPSRTASCAPGAKAGGTGPNLICSGLNAFCGGAGVAARMVAHNSYRQKRGFHFSLPPNKRRNDSTCQVRPARKPSTHRRVLASQRQEPLRPRTTMSSEVGDVHAPTLRLPNFGLAFSTHCGVSWYVAN